MNSQHDGFNFFVSPTISKIVGLDEPDQQVKAPPSEFELYQAVTLKRGDKKYNTRITRRYYNPDLKQWYYEVAIDPLICLINPSNLSAR